MLTNRQFDSPGIHFSEILLEIQDIFSNEDTFEIVVCKISAILFRLNVLMREVLLMHSSFALLYWYTLVLKGL